MKVMMKLFQIPGVRVQFWNSYRNFGCIGEDQGGGSRPLKRRPRFVLVLADPKMIQFPESWVSPGVSYFDGFVP